MSEPTIEEMLEWLTRVTMLEAEFQRDKTIRQAIRAILEGHRDGRYVEKVPPFRGTFTPARHPTHIILDDIDGDKAKAKDAEQ